jgi:hypothetical protein
MDDGDTNGQDEEEVDELQSEEDVSGPNSVEPLLRANVA